MRHKTRIFCFQLALRFLGLLFLLFFTAAQYHLWLDGQKVHDMELWGYFRKPVPSLGPLYFLVHPSTYNAPLGVALLCLLVPPLLSFVVWPRWWTALLMFSAALAWVVPGIIYAIKDLP